MMEVMAYDDQCQKRIVHGSYVVGDGKLMRGNITQIRNLKAFAI